MVNEGRRQLALSQEVLARKPDVSYATVNRWENGQSRPSKPAKAQLNAFLQRMSKDGRLKLPT